jgi:hypothetical protein
VGDFAIRWKLTLRLLFDSQYFFLAISRCGTQIRWKTKTAGSEYCACSGADFFFQRIEEKMQFHWKKNLYLESTRFFV